MILWFNSQKHANETTTEPGRIASLVFERGFWVSRVGILLSTSQVDVLVEHVFWARYMLPKKCHEGTVKLAPAIDLGGRTLKIVDQCGKEPYIVRGT